MNCVSFIFYCAHFAIFATRTWQFVFKPILYDYSELLKQNKNINQVSLLGLLAKIKCSICSYQFNIWYGRHSRPCILI